MSGALGALLIHGIGTPKPDFAKGLTEKIGAQRWRVVRKFIVHNLGDAVAYQRESERTLLDATDAESN